MGNKKTITIGSIIALIILAIVIVITLINGLKGFSLILGALFIILTIILATYIKEEPDEYSAFIKNKKKILRTYDSIIVEVEDIPNIAGKNIIKVKSIEDLVDAQLELREPIYYKNDNDSCFFMLLHYNEACVYILRMNDGVVSPTEQSIKYMKEEPKKKDQESILDNVENTIVYKLDELRSFKISPIRSEQPIQVVDDTAIKEDLEKDVTKEDLEDEISKTMYIKDLKEKMKQYEENNTVEIDEEEILEEQKKAREQLESTPKEEKAKEVIKEEVEEKKPKKVVKRVTKNNHSSRRASNYKKVK